MQAHFLHFRSSFNAVFGKERTEEMVQILKDNCILFNTAYEAKKFVEWRQGFTFEENQLDKEMYQDLYFYFLDQSDCFVIDDEDDEDKIDMLLWVKEEEAEDQALWASLFEDEVLEFSGVE